MSGEKNDKQREARRLATEAANSYADSFEVTEGWICTGYVMVFELTAAADKRWLGWITGSGGPPTSEVEEGLHPWRVAGMLRHAVHDIYSDNVTRNEEDED